MNNNIWSYSNLRPTQNFIAEIYSSPFPLPDKINFKDFLEQNYSIIKKEYLKVSKKYNSDTIFKWESQNLVEEIKTWKEIKIGKAQQARKLFPKTVNLLNHIESIYGLPLSIEQDSIKFSVLSPNMHIKKHCGPHNNRVRIHLGLIIPKGCYIRCDKQVKTWEEGKIIVLDDAFEHEVWNWSDEERVILIIDIWNPNISPYLKNKILKGEI